MKIGKFVKELLKDLLHAIFFTDATPLIAFMLVLIVLGILKPNWWK